MTRRGSGCDLDVKKPPGGRLSKVVFDASFFHDRVGGMTRFASRGHGDMDFTPPPDLMGTFPLTHQRKAVLFKHGYDLFKVSVHALATAAPMWW